MSGICGIVRLDDSHVSPAELRAMTRALERRGPDGTSEWIEGGVALGHTLLATTPEALVERLPLTDPGSGCKITADVRLDNREELLPALGLDSETRVVGDGELILRAYLEWGEDCPKHLLGDFAFAIWDPRSQTLFCARDHMGMRPLVYAYLPGRLFAFASDEDCLLAHAAMPRQINEARIADFLEEMEGVDFTSTFFEAIFRLAPACSLTLAKGGVSVRHYWTLRSPPELKLGSSDEYARAFLGVFKEAVRCRLRCAGTVGAMVSGGIDSNAVAAIAAGLMASEGGGPLPTFSVIGPAAEPCPETTCILDATANPRFAPALFDYATLGDDWAELAASLENSANPFDCHMSLIRAVYLLAHHRNVRVVLDGAGGDLVLIAGNRVAQLLREGRFRSALGVARSNPEAWGLRTPLRVLARGAWVAFVPRRIRGIRQQLAWRIGDLASARNPKVRSSLAKKIRLPMRRIAYRRLIGVYRADSREYRLAHLGHPHTVAARERYDRVASALSIEPRDPFLDIRVIQFCLSVPDSELKSGWPKALLRRAMEGLVPDSIRWRAGKSHLGARFTAQLVHDSETWRTRWTDVAKLAAKFAPMAARADRNAKHELDSGTFIELFTLGCWLERYGARRVQAQLGESDHG